MDRKAFTDLAKRLEEVNGVVEKLDPAIRQDAFSLLKPYIDAVSVAPSGGGKTAEIGSDSSPEEAALDLNDAELFFTTHEGGKPAENAYLAAAYLYGQYGASPFSLMLGLADIVVVVILLLHKPWFDVMGRWRATRPPADIRFSLAMERVVD